MELRLRMSGKARDFVEQVLHEMLVRFPITRDEAVTAPRMAAAGRCHGSPNATPAGLLLIDMKRCG
ncbi:hypothetical protein [Micromonospora parathelypteridis]|uniref:Uncharacterized protein n=1 Tax=Micromonospora parathelypteridis TaxID=1839617 RepID=A0A840VT94_9ACTN|nr:hypothetical protein [Micromonospora parathelypteridis]MBB5476238.1 hypothetical protein [Micromonospora parathelypteridis]GGO14123.1 hypothetical protein GCM10011576_24810 [Micromonospora parathelypteridis]